MMTFNPTTDLEATKRLTKDLAQAAGTLTRAEARFLVSAYYRMQENRIRTAHQTRTLSDQPHQTLEWLFEQNNTLENQVKRALGYYASAHPVGEWMQSITGIGPVISAGLLAHIDITICNTASRIWRYAGLDPTVKWPNTTQVTDAIKSHYPDGVPKVIPFIDATQIAVEFGRNPGLFMDRLRREHGNSVTKTQFGNLIHELQDDKIKFTKTEIREALNEYSVPTRVKLDELDDALLTDIFGINPNEFVIHARKTFCVGVTPETLTKEIKRLPWNAELKSLCAFKLGESFVKVQNNPNDIYGKLYATRKAQEQTRNDALEFRDIALQRANTVSKSTEAYRHYSAGKLPPAHIHARARRYAVKIFLSHLHEVWYEMHFGKQPPAPYAMVHLGHTDYIPPPNWG